MIRTGTIQQHRVEGRFPDLTDKAIRKKLKHVWGYFVQYDGKALTFTGTAKQLDAFIEACREL